MTTPRPHADLATRYFADDTMKCWVREKNGDEDWTLIRDPSFNSSNLEYYVGHEPPPPPKRYIGLNVNGREWVLPEPLKKAPEKGAEYWIVNNATHSGAMRLHWDDHIGERLALNRNTIHATAADAQEWADFDKWCRGVGMTDTIDTLRAQLDELKAARVAYANEFPLNADGEPDVGNIHANIRLLKAQLAEAQRDSERLDWMIEQRAYVVSDPDCCDGYWLRYHRHDGTVWVQVTEHETPRAAIDAAMGKQ